MSSNKKDLIYKYHRNLINYSFIVGIKEESLYSIKEKEIIIPDILFCYPERDINFYRELIDFVCPNGIHIYNENSFEGDISYHPVILTNEKGERYYLYILKIIDIYNNLKIPIFIVLCSFVEDFDAFKEVLDEVLKIIKNQKNIEMAKMELLNYLIFLHSIIIPPSHTLFTINFRYSKVNFYFHSLYEIPCHYYDNDINILFNILSTGKIIKLIYLLIKDKQIIIYGDNIYLICSVINALNKLLFPFKYSNNLLTVISKEKLIILNSPGPQLYGIISSSCNFDDLINHFSGKCLCNLNNGKLINSNPSDLNEKNLDLLKKQIQFLKNPELFKFNDMFNEREKKIIKKFDLNQNFSRNVQNVFFNFFRYPLDKYKQFITGRIIDDKKFIKEAENYEKKKLFQILLKSSLIDIFIGESLDNKTDFNNSYCFDAIISNKKKICQDKININSALKIEIFCPKINFNLIKSIINEQNIENIQNNESIKNYFINYKNNEENDNLIVNNHISAKKKSNVNLNFQNPTYYLMQNKNEEEEIISLLDNNTKKNFKNYINNFTPFSFHFYGKNGFNKFLQNLILILKGQKNVNEILFEQNFYNQIYEQISQIIDSLPLNPNISEENEDIISTSKYIKRKSINHKQNYSNENNQLLVFSNILEGVTQRYLFYAFYLENILLDKSDFLNYKQIENDYILESIIGLYHHAISYGEFEFPFFRYKLILSKLQKRSLNNFKHKFIPLPLKNIFDELYDNTFEELRMTILKNNSLNNSKNYISIFNNNIIKNNTIQIKKFKTDKIQYFEKNDDLRKSEQLSNFNLISENIKNEIIHISKKNKLSQINNFEYNNYNDFVLINKNLKKNNSSKNVNDNFTFFLTDFKIPFTLNKVKLKMEKINPVKLLMEIGEDLIQLLKNIYQKNITFEEINTIQEIKNDILKIKKKVEKLQIVNLAKLEKLKEKYSFWLNAFNFLTIYSIIYTNYQPKDFDDWKLFLFNCRFNIGRYEITLLEIQNKILLGTNYYGLEISFTDNYIQRFCLNEINILIDFGFYYHIKSNYFILKIYSDNEFESQLYKTTIEFFKKNIYYSLETEEIHISKYLAYVRPDFLDESYKYYEDYIDKNLYINLEEKKYIHIKIENLNWELCDNPNSSIYQ